MTQSFVNESPETKRHEHLERPHPSEIFKRRCLSKTNKKRSDIAIAMGVSTKHLSRFVNGHVNVTIDLARKLEACTNISARSWLYMQMQYDLYRTANQNLPKNVFYS